MTAIPLPGAHLMTFKQSLTWKADQTRYELHNGTPIEMQPTLSVCRLIEGEYQVRLFRGQERVQSVALSDLQLTAAQIFGAGR